MNFFIKNKKLLHVILIIFCVYCLSYLLFRIGNAIVRTHDKGGATVVYHIRGIRYLYEPLWIVERKSRTLLNILDRKLQKKKNVENNTLLVVQKKSSQLKKIDRLVLHQIVYQSLPMRCSTDSLVLALGIPDTQFNRETARMSSENVSAIQRMAVKEMHNKPSDSTYAVSDFISEEITYQHYVYTVGSSSTLTFAVHEKNAQIMEAIFHVDDSFTLYLEDTIPFSGAFSFKDAEKHFATTLVNITIDSSKQKLLLFKTNSNNGSAAYETPMLYFQEEKLVRFFNYPQF